MGKKVTCAGKTKRGTRCKSTAVLENGLCMAHQPEEVREARGFGGSQPGAGAPRRPRATEVLRERVEAEIDKVLAPLFDGLEAQKPVVVSDGHLDGAHIEWADDMPTRLRAAADILDRVYGKPKQTTEIAGPDGGPVRVDVPRTAQRASQVARILAGAGALPSPAAHEGRRRAQPAAPAPVRTNGHRNGHG
jgi:hypothetical protein